MLQQLWCLLSLAAYAAAQRVNSHQSSHSGGHDGGPDGHQTYNPREHGHDDYRHRNYKIGYIPIKIPAFGLSRKELPVPHLDVKDREFKFPVPKLDYKDVDLPLLDVDFKEFTFPFPAFEAVRKEAWVPTIEKRYLPILKPSKDLHPKDLHPGTDVHGKTVFHEKDDHPGGEQKIWKPTRPVRKETVRYYPPFKSTPDHGQLRKTDPHLEHEVSVGYHGFALDDSVDSLETESPDDSSLSGTEYEDATSESLVVENLEAAELDLSTASLEESTMEPASEVADDSMSEAASESVSTAPETHSDDPAEEPRRLGTLDDKGLVVDHHATVYDPTVTKKELDTVKLSTALKTEHLPVLTVKKHPVKIPVPYFHNQKVSVPVPYWNKKNIKVPHVVYGTHDLKWPIYADYKHHPKDDEYKVHPRDDYGYEGRY